MREEVNQEAHDLIYALGGVVHDFNHLESDLALCIALLVDPIDPETGRVITAGKAYSALVDLFNALVLHRLKSRIRRSLEKDLDVLVKRLTEVNEMRNKVVHSQYLYGVQQQSFQRSKLSLRSKKGIKVDEVNINSIEMRQLSKTIHRLSFDLRKFTETEIVPVVLAPVWKDKDNDFGKMWLIWSMQYKGLDEKEGNVYWQLVHG